MISTRQIVGLAVVYTMVVAAGVSLTDVGGGVVFGVAFAWFAVGRMIGRGEDAPTRRYRWGRQK